MLHRQPRRSLSSLSTSPRRPCFTVSIAETVPSLTSPTSAPCPSVRKTRGTGRAGEATKDGARSIRTKRSASGFRPTSDSRPTMKRSRLGDYIVPPCNWDLWQTASWLNFYLGRDHTAKRLGIKPPGRKDQGQAMKSPAAKSPGETLVSDGPRRFCYV